MQKRPKRPRRRTIALAVVAGAVLLALALFDWNWFKGPISRYVSQKTGRDFAIQGDLDVDLSLKPRITAERLVLGNTPWGSRPDMATVGRLGFRIDLWQLLRGEIVLPELIVSQPQILLEKSPDGQRNWVFRTEPEKEPPQEHRQLPEIGGFRIDGGALFYLDHGNHTRLQLAVSTPRLASPREQTILVSGKGRYAERDFSIRRAWSNLSLKPQITAEGVVLGNAPWGSRPNMAEIERLGLQIDLEGLLQGRILLPQLILTQPDILLENSLEGQHNWDFGPPRKEARRDSPTIGVLRIHRGVFGYRDPRPKTDISLRISTARPRPGGGEPMMAVEGGGRYKAAAFALEGRGGTILSLRDPNRPYPIDVRVRIGETQADIEGTLTDPVHLRGMKINLNLRGTDLSKLYPFIPVPLPVTPPYSLLGHLDHVGKTWTFSDFKGRVGDSDLGGDFAVDLSGARPFMRGDLLSRRLDFDDMAGLVGAPPSPQETASTEQRRQAARQARRVRVLPDRPYDLSRLRAANANVKFRGERVISPSLPVEDMTAHLILQEGKLTLKPLNFGMAGGRLASTITMNARRNPIATRADIRVQQIELRKLFPRFRLNQGSAGRIGGRARFAARGNSIARMLGSADGDFALVMSGGRMSNLLLELADIDVAEALPLLLTGDKNVPIRCMVADFTANDGKLAAKTLVLDTTDTTITGKGAIDFRDEIVNLRLQAHSKDPSLVALRGPVRVTGRFKDVNVRPEARQILTRVGIAAALGALINPLAALIPLIELGLGKDSDCAALIVRVKQKIGPAQIKVGAAQIDGRR